MDLVSIYNVMPPIEVLFTVIAVALFIVAFVLFVTCDDNDKIIKHIGIGVACTIIGAIILTWNTYHPNQTRYEYFVTDMTQLQQMVEDGWVVVYSEDNIYNLKKGE